MRGSLIIWMTAVDMTISTVISVGFFIASGLRPPRLDAVPHHLGDVRAADVLHRADAGRRGDVDLGEVVADYVDAHENEAALAQVRPEPRADLALARRQLGRLG